MNTLKQCAKNNSAAYSGTGTRMKHEHPQPPTKDDQNDKN